MLKNLLSGGAAELVKNVGGVLDNLTTSKEERLEAERKIYCRFNCFCNNVCDYDSRLSYRLCR